MPEVICFANMKGGVGKTTLCVNIAYSLFTRGFRVLLVDNDPQFNATSALVKPQRYINEVLKPPTHSTIYHIYERPPRIGGKQPVLPSPKSFITECWWIKEDKNIRLDLICSQIELYETLSNPSHKEYLLDKFLRDHGKDYDYILIDCPPTPSVLTLSAFAASNWVIIPVAPDYFATLGLPQFLGTLEEFKETLEDRHGVKVLGVVFTNVPRQETPETLEAYSRVKRALAERKSEIQIFDNKMSHFGVYQKTLWQAVPVQQIKGKGTRGKSEASRELSLIREEMLTKISARKAQSTEI